MMILLSIKQVYCDLILNGAKRFEFRKRLPNGLQRGDEVAIYCTRPVSRVIAYFRIDDVIQATRQNLWRQTRHAAGIIMKRLCAILVLRNKRTQSRSETSMY